VPDATRRPVHAHDSVWKGHRACEPRGDGRSDCRRGSRRIRSTPDVIGLDTNVLVRYIVQDDPVQSARATEFVEGRLSIGNPGFISVVAMAETAWVLERAYGLSPQRIAAAVEAVLQVDVFAVECEQDVFAAMVTLRDGHGSFAGALIGRLGTRAGCTHTVTGGAACSGRWLRWRWVRWRRCGRSVKCRPGRRRRCRRSNRARRRARRALRRPRRSSVPRVRRRRWSRRRR